MKRLHLHIGVEDLPKAIQFYSTLFGQSPTKRKDDYAKWMLEEPKINFAISTRVGKSGLDHLGIQVETEGELAEITHRLEKANIELYDQGESTCCYANSKKAWVEDPSGIPWEAYLTMSDAEVFHPKTAEASSACCPDSNEKTACCG